MPQLRLWSDCIELDFKEISYLVITYDCSHQPQLCMEDLDHGSPATWLQEFPPIKHLLQKRLQGYMDGSFCLGFPFVTFVMSLWKTQIFFAFQIGHIEIGTHKILGCLDAIFRDIGQCFQSKCIRMNVTIAAFFLPSTSIQGAIIPPNLPKNDELPIPEVLT